MFKEHLEIITEGAVKKYQFLKSGPMAYIVSAMWAGASIGIGTILIATLGAYGDKYGYAMTKAVMGFSFSVALSIVLMWGLELFTSSNLFMTVGGLQKRIKWRSVLSVWLITFVGNLVGAIILSLIYKNTGLADFVSEYFLKMAESKTSPDAISLFAKGMLCNVMVCLAVLISYKMKSESGKLIMVFLCIYTFIILGFEHSVANMTLFSMTTFLGFGEMITPELIMHNMIPVTLGNIAGGGLLLGGSLYFMGKK
ncbi:MAG: formate/nitrite transporter family protein [Bacillota bacterium]|nr:formate/nitrite transporter family protein [Bacillota bacterium]